MKGPPGDSRWACVSFSDPQLKCQLRLHRIVICHLKIFDRNVFEPAAFFLVKYKDRLLRVVCHNFGASQHLLRVVHVAVVDLLVGDEVREHAGLVTCYPRDHHKERRVLDLVDAAGSGRCQHIAAPLDHAHVQIFPADIPHGEEGARRKSGRFPEVGLLPERDDFTPPVGVLFDIIDQLVDEVVALYSCSVALADRAVPDVPGIPPCDAEVPHFGQDVGRMLIDREDLTDARLPGLAAQRADRELTFAEIIFAHHVIDADGIGGRAVFVSGARIHVFVAVVEDVADVLYQELVSFGHNKSFLSRKDCFSPGDLTAQNRITAGPRLAIL